MTQHLTIVSIFVFQEDFFYHLSTYYLYSLIFMDEIAYLDRTIIRLSSFVYLNTRCCVLLFSVNLLGSDLQHLFGHICVTVAVLTREKNLWILFVFCCEFPVAYG
jgi:hypothetical protein